MINRPVKSDNLIAISIITVIGILAITFAIWWIGYSLFAHQHSSDRMGGIFWLYVTPCGVITYLLARRRKQNLKLLLFLTACASPLSAILSTFIAAITGVALPIHAMYILMGSMAAGLLLSLME